MAHPEKSRYDAVTFADGAISRTLPQCKREKA